MTGNWIKVAINKLKRCTIWVPHELQVKVADFQQHNTWASIGYKLFSVISINSTVTYTSLSGLSSWLRHFSSFRSICLTWAPFKGWTFFIIVRIPDGKSDMYMYKYSRNLISVEDHFHDKWSEKLRVVIG